MKASNWMLGNGVIILPPQARLGIAEKKILPGSLVICDPKKLPHEYDSIVDVVEPSSFRVCEKGARASVQAWEALRNAGQVKATAAGAQYERFTLSVEQGGQLGLKVGGIGMSAGITWTGSLSAKVVNPEIFEVADPVLEQLVDAFQPKLKDNEGAFKHKDWFTATRHVFFFVKSVLFTTKFQLGVKHSATIKVTLDAAVEVVPVDVHGSLSADEKGTIFTLAEREEPFPYGLKLYKVEYKMPTMDTPKHLGIFAGRMARTANTEADKPSETAPKVNLLAPTLVSRDKYDEKAIATYEEAIATYEEAIASEDTRDAKARQKRAAHADTSQPESKKKRGANKEEEAKKKGSR